MARTKRLKNIEDIKQCALPVLREAGVVRSSLFGSYARGEETQKSDIDFLIEFEQGKTLFDLVSLERRLTSVLGHDVDVVTYRSLSPYLRERVLHEELRIL